MSTIPVPKPRSLAQEKRPVPLPRTNISKSESSDGSKVNNPPVNNTLTRRISNTSKQIVEEISGVLQKNLEITKLSFSKRNARPHTQEEEKGVQNDIKNLEKSPEIFNNLTFESPLTVNQESSGHSSFIEENSLYGNSLKDFSFNESDDDIESLPPPSHPPPPLPDVSYYDTPQKNIQSVQPILNPSSFVPEELKTPSKFVSIPNSPDKPPPTPTRPAPPLLSTTTSIIPQLAERTTYEAVFPVHPVFLSNTDSGESSGNDSKSGTIDRTESIRPESWNFYDPVTLNESTYSNTMATKKR